MASLGEEIIRDNLEGFLKLIETIRNRYLALKNDLTLGTGEYVLLTDQEIITISGMSIKPIF
jgi:hypothetical protein